MKPEGWMDPQRWVDVLPFWAVFLGMVLLVLLAIEVGHTMGLWVRKRRDPDAEGPIGSVVGAVLGLLAFILAFTFQMAADRFGARKHLLLDDVLAIETAVRRAELLPEQHREASLLLLKRYVDGRVEIHERPEMLPRRLVEFRSIHDELWKHAIELARADMNSDIGALYVEAINEVISLHTSRVVVSLQHRIPSRIWAGLLFVTFFSMASVGFQFGLAGRRGSLVGRLALALTFAAVMTLISDLDRVSGSALKVSHQPMIDLQNRLAELPPKPQARP